MRKNYKKWRSKKRMFAAGAVVISAIMLAGGAYAWTDYSQEIQNRFTGNLNHGLTLHDDFDGENKDVYVENSGDGAVYVRVRIAEYMQIGDTNMLGQDLTDTSNPSLVTARDTDQWVIHKYIQDSATGTTADCGAYKVDANGNTVTNGITYHSYYQWDMSGKQIWYDPGVPGLVSTVLDGTQTDANGNAVLDEFGQEKKIVDDGKGERQTLAASTPMTMTAYVALLDKKAQGNITDDELTTLNTPRWLLDEDGWAYWSHALQPDTATNLLLDAITAAEPTPADTWYYATHVWMQGVSLNELPTTWEAVEDGQTECTQSTENARKVFDAWRAVYGL